MKTVKVEFAAEYADQPEKKPGESPKTPVAWSKTSEDSLSYGAVHGMAWTFRSPDASIIYVNENFKVNIFIFIYLLVTKTKYSKEKSK